MRCGSAIASISASAGLLLSLGLGCAASPRSIEPAEVDPGPYQAMTCQELVTDATSAETQLREVSARQKAAADKDALWVFLLGFPIASMQGEDIGDQVAEHKGRLSIIRRLHEDRCGATAESDADASF